MWPVNANGAIADSKRVQNKKGDAESRRKRATESAASENDSFSQVLTKKDLIPKIPFIKKVIANGFNTETMPRVEQDCIHKVKGLTFDNIIVDLSVYRQERNSDEARRLAYVAYSRGKKDCWTIGTSNHKFKSSLAGIQNNRHYYLKEEDDTQRYV
mgnify:CR=1 FL=1